MRRMRSNRFTIPGWSVGYHNDIGAEAAVRTAGRDRLFVMTTPDDRAPRSLDEEVAVGLYLWDGEAWEQLGYADFPTVTAAISLGDAALIRAIDPRIVTY